MPFRFPGLLFVALAALMAAGCTSTPSEDDYSSLPPSPRHPASQAQQPADAPWNDGSYVIPDYDGSLPLQVDLLDRIRAGYALPDAYNDDVAREIENYRSRPDYLDRTFRRGTRYLHYIVSEIERRGMPMELALLPVVESAFNPVAYSRSHAAGLWQFIPSTGKHFGLEQNWWIDERRDVIKSTSAALDYLQYLNGHFNGDWFLAIAAYNGGEGTIGKAIRQNAARGRPTDFFSLNLRAETRNYVPKLLAISRIVANPKAYGLQFSVIPNQPFFTVVDPGQQVDLGEAARMAGISSDDVFALNPAFNRMKTPPNGPHRLLLPIDNAQAFQQAYTSGTVPPSAVPAQTEVLVGHRVRRGESLSAIARRYGVSVAALRDANQLGTTVIHPGDKLTIPGSETLVPARPGLPEQARTPRSTASVHKVRSGDTLWGVARRYGVTVPQLAAANEISAQSTLKVGTRLKIPGRNSAAQAETTRVTYKVRRGDTLSQIAQKFDVSVRQLMSWNDIRRSNALRAGQRLVLYVDPGKASGG
jgi:membrane-bound lytic murein transglycosylase D